VSNFADPGVIKVVREHFVAVAADDWYARRRQDPEGEFFRGVANQGPRKGEGGSTRQGIYLCTAGGRLLGYRNNRSPELMRSLLVQGLREWQRLPAAERQPGAIDVAPLAKVDPHFTRSAPAGSLILNVYTRILDHDADQQLCRGTCSKAGGDRAARDHLWIPEAEWKALIPSGAKAGDVLPVPKKLLLRVIRFHLMDNTRGEPPIWKRDEVRAGSMTVTVETVSAKEIKLRLDGTALLATAKDPKEASRGFDARLLGYIEYNVANKMIRSFDLIAVGDHWGEGTFTRGARPGRTPLGVAFRLTTGKAASDRVPPQGSREARAYLEPDR
jgi:hypothetical protein